MKPLWASSRRQIRQTPNLRYTARARPQRRHRVYSRVLNFAGRAWRTRWDVLATSGLLPGAGLGLGVGVGADVRVVLAGERHAERLEEGVGLLVGLRARRDGHV